MKNIFLLLLLFIFNSTGGFGQNEISLITPYDKDTIETVHPIFNWHYIKHSMKRSDVRYTFTLVELKDEQSAQAGILVNTPIIHIESVEGFQMSYPFDAPDLEYNHRYGWRLQRKDKGVITNESEVWEFILYREVKIPMKYALLSTVPNSTIYNTDDKGFFFKLRSKYKQIKPLRIVVLDKELHSVKVNMGDDKKMGLDNRLEKTSVGYHFLKTDSYSVGVYTLKVMDMKGNVYSTMFKVN